MFSFPVISCKNKSHLIFSFPIDIFWCEFMNMPANNVKLWDSIGHGNMCNNNVQAVKKSCAEATLVQGAWKCIL